MTIEAMKQALDALEELHDTTSYWWQEVDEATLAKIEPAITALRTAIAEAEKQEPVAWISPKGNIHFDPYLDSAPLYTTPPAAQRKPLTDEEIESIAAQTLFPVPFARQIEAAHGIKENT